MSKIIIIIDTKANRLKKTLKVYRAEGYFDKKIKNLIQESFT